MCDQWKMVMPLARRCFDCDKQFLHDKHYKQYHSDSGFRKDTIKRNYESMKKRLKTNPESRKKFNAMKKRYYHKKMKDPEYRAKTLARTNANFKKRMEDPDYRVKHAAMQKESKRKSAIKKNKQALLALRLKLGDGGNDG